MWRACACVSRASFPFLCLSFDIITGRWLMQHKTTTCRVNFTSIQHAAVVQSTLQPFHSCCYNNLCSGACLVVGDVKFYLPDHNESGPIVDLAEETPDFSRGIEIMIVSILPLHPLVTVSWKVAILSKPDPFPPKEKTR